LVADTALGGSFPVRESNKKLRTSEEADVVVVVSLAIVAKAS
jgi:hypothetical protein